MSGTGSAATDLITRPGDDRPRGPGGRPELERGRGSLVRPIVIVGGGVLLAVVTHGLAVLVVVLALVVMVMVHELGHFATAKWTGMKVTEYFLGFGPKVWSIRRGETEYGMKAIPAGGYVRIVGMTILEDVDPEDESRSYRQASFPRRVLVAVAGSGMHVVMAFLLLFSFYAIAGAPTPSAPTIVALASFASGASPAQRAGLRPGDTVVSVDGHALSNITEFATFVNEHAGVPLALVVRRANSTIRLSVTPVDGRHVTETIAGQQVQGPNPNGPATGIIGVELTGSRNARVAPVLAVGRAGSELGSMFAQTFVGLGEVFSLHGLGSFAHHVVTAGSTPSATTPASSGSSGGSNQGQILSIVGAVQIGAQAAGRNIGELLFLLAAINLFIGVVNLFPMLPLDGGHVAIAVYERIRSRRGRSYHADVAKLMPVAYVFLFFVVLLGLGALYMNIVNPAQLPGG